MSRVPPLLGLSWRASRFARRRLLLFLSGVSLGVAALVAVELFRAGVSEGVGRGARALLGADLVVATRRPLGPRAEALVDSLQGGGARVARVTTFVSMATSAATGETRLARVRALEGQWPFYGRPVTRPLGAWSALSRGEAIADGGLLVALGLQVGDSLMLGDARLRLAGELVELPGEADVSSAFAPRLFVPAAVLPASGLLGFGSRVEHEAFVALDDARHADRIARVHGDELRAENARVRTARQAQEDVAESLGRLGTFLRLLGFAALLVGGLGVAAAIGAYMAHEVEAVATLRCLGATARQVVVLYLLQTGALAFAGALLGVALGLAVGDVLPDLLQGMLPVRPTAAGRTRAAALGLTGGTAAALAFAILPILRVRAVPPLAALRLGFLGEPRRAHDRVYLVVAAALGTGFVALAVVETGGWRAGVGLALGAAVAVAALLAATRLAAWVARRAVPDAAGFALRRGSAGLRRPGGGAAAVVTSLGLSLLLLATLLLLQATLLAPLREAQRPSRANLVLWDVQTDQVDAVEATLRARGLPVLQRTPIVPMRIASVNGRVPVDPRAPAAQPGGWALRREYRSTFRDTVVASETVRDGRWWRAGERAARDGVWPVSLEEGIAEELRVKVGGRIDWDVQGVVVPTRVASLREVDWARFEPNFFAVFPTAALADAPRTMVLLTRVADARAAARLQRDLVAAHPNVAALDLARIQTAVDAIVARVSAAIRFLAGFTVAAAAFVLLGALAATRLERLREAVLLRALGAGRGQLRGALVVEHVMLALVAVLAGLSLAVAAGATLARWMLESALVIPPLPVAVLAGAALVLAGTMGALAGSEAFRRTPVEALRED